MYQKKLLFSFLIITVLIIFGCTPKAPSVTTEPPVVEPAVQERVPVVEEAQEVAEVKEKVTTEQPILPEPAQKRNLIFPTLTYDGAYNGLLYGTSEQVGSASMDTYFKLLDNNGINYFIGMFGIEGEPSANKLTSDEGLGEVIDAAQKHPYRIIPFFNPGIGGEEVEKYLGNELTGMYTKTLAASKQVAGKNFIRGLGEIETQEWSVRHNDQKVLQLVNLAKNNNIHFMFHPVASKADDVKKIIEAYPNTIFLIHLYREDLEDAKNTWISMLKEHDNLYFSMDAAHIIHVNNMDIIYDYDGANTESSIRQFISTYDTKEKSLVDEAIRAYKPLVDAAPDKIMWGTEIGPKYAFDPQVFDRAIKASRLVIAGFEKEHQEAVGYKNALRVFGEGVTVDASIKVLNTRSWPECSDAQMSKCDESCEIPDSDILTAEQEACYSKCLIEKRCTEVVKMDVG
ncbi:amidohydrolase family protein [Candidatus Woesearchaeota archaeon]|nr:amidohydrolase family protein [Candidatus Woesearchaeota archaeon]